MLLSEDSPRYATGYTSLFNSIGTVVETHMLKPYDKRVDATYKYMLVNLENIDKNYKKIKELRKENLKQYAAGNKYPIRWKVDSAKYSTMDFKGFEQEGISRVEFPDRKDCTMTVISLLQKK